KSGAIEMYAHDRFFTLTTDHVQGTPTNIAERQEKLASLYHRIAPVGAKQDVQNTRGWGGSENALTELPPEARHDPLLQQLLRGDTTGFSSPSNADFVLALK